MLGFHERRPLIAVFVFFSLSLLFSYWFLVLRILWPGVSLPAGSREYLAGLAKFGPTIAGVVCILLFKGLASASATLRSLLDIWHKPAALAFALVFPLLAVLSAVAIHVAVVNRDVDIEPFRLAMFAGALYWIGLKTTSGGGMGEEIGWRGFALPVLLAKIGPVRASLLVGLHWSAWHFPALVRHDDWLYLFYGQTLFTTGLSFILTWLYLWSRGSLGCAVILHGAVNGWGVWIESSWSPALASEDWGIVSAYIYVGVALVLIPWLVRHPGIGGDRRQQD